MHLIIKRSDIWSSTIKALSSVSIADFVNKKLKISFLGEEGVDNGGLTREWINLAIKEVFDPRFGLFRFSTNNVTI